MRQVVEEYDGVLLGETLDELFVYDRAASYCKDGQLSLAFNFRLLHSRFCAASLKRAIRAWEEELGEDGWPFGSALPVARLVPAATAVL